MLFSTDLTFILTYYPLIFASFLRIAFLCLFQTILLAHFKCIVFLSIYLSSALLFFIQRTITFCSALLVCFSYLFRSTLSSSLSGLFCLPLNFILYCFICGLFWIGLYHNKNIQNIVKKDICIF